MNHVDDDLARELRRELQGNLVPFDPARAQHMIDEAIAASPVRRVLRSRWTMPLLASGAVAAVVGGGAAGVAAMQPDGKPAHPGGGPTATVAPSPIPTTPVPTTPAQCEPVPTVTSPVPSSPRIPAGPAATLPSKGDTCVLVGPTSVPSGSLPPTMPGGSSAPPAPTMPGGSSVPPAPTSPTAAPTTSVPNVPTSPAMPPATVPHFSPSAGVPGRG